MGKAKSGDTVKVHYTGKLDDGSVFDTSSGGDPLEFTIGTGQILPKFEEAVIGLEPGEKTITAIKAEDAYGPHHPDMVFEVERSNFPDDASPKLGDRFQIPQPDDEVLTVTVVSATETKVSLDANHPMAGKDLNFDIELIEIA